MIPSHVLMQGGCSLFPVLLSSFNMRGRRHYTQAINRYHENPSMLYTMIKLSCYEQNAKTLNHRL